MPVINLQTIVFEKASEARTKLAELQKRAQSQSGVELRATEMRIAFLVDLERQLQSELA